MIYCTFRKPYNRHIWLTIGSITAQRILTIHICKRTS